MVYTIYSRRGSTVATLRSWDGKVTATHSASGHWTWCVGRSVASVLQWAREHFMWWEVTTDETVWGKVIRETEQQ